MSPIRTLEYAECVTLLDTLQNDRGTRIRKRKGLRNYTMALCMLDAGMRVGEVSWLRVSDLFYQNGPVTSIVVRAVIAKRGVERTIPVTERLSNAIKMMDKYIWSRPVVCTDHYAFFANQRDTPLTTRQIERIIGTASKRAFNRSIHPHMLRHTFATRLMRKTSMRVVQELLGHKSIKTTQIYTHPNAQDLKKAIGLIEPRKVGAE